MKIIDFLEKELIKEQKQQEDNERYQKILNQVKSLENDLNSFTQINLDEVKELNVELFTEEQITQLKWIGLLLKGNSEQKLNFELVDEQKKLINIFIEKTSSFLEEKIIADNNVEETKILLNKINSDENLLIETIDLEYLFNLLDHSDLSSEDQLDLLTEILKKNRDSFYNKLDNKSTEQIEDEEELIETNLDYEEVKNKLSEYNIECSQINNFEELVLKYGNTDNIIGILNILDKNNLLSRIDYTTASFAYILTFSSPELVEKQIIVSKEYIVDFNDLLLHTSNFIMPKKEKTASKTLVKIGFKERKTTTPKNKNKIKPIGTASNFDENLSYLKREGFDIAKILKNNSSILTIIPHVLKENIEVLKLYGFDILNEDFSLSSLSNNHHITPLIDTYIELGLFDYIKENPSGLNNYTNKLFKNAFYKNKNNEELFTNSGLIGTLRKNTLEPNDPKDEIINLEVKYQEMKDIDLYYDCVKNAIDVEIEDIQSDPLMACLENFKLEKNDYIYRIDNILISRLKVLRIYKQMIKYPELDKVNGLLFAMTYNSLLSNEDYELIRNYVEHWHKYTQKEEFKNGLFKTI